MKRSEFLKLSQGVLLACLAQSIPVSSFGASLVGGATAQNDRVWVLIHLRGGNDGLNTVVPLDMYDALAQLRRNILPGRKQVLQVTDTVALHPAMGEVRKMYNNGWVHIVQQVGFMQDCFQHGEATNIWLNGGVGTTNCWWQRIPELDDKVVQVEQLTGQCSLANQLNYVSRMIQQASPNRVYIVSQDGFDTHTNQVATQAFVLKELSDSVAGFFKDAVSKGFDHRVIASTFSEFGRRIMANECGGTDHGNAAPVFIFGKQVQGGITGTNPYISPYTSVHDNIPVQADFGSVYATILSGWLGVNHRRAFPGNHDMLPLFSTGV